MDNKNMIIIGLVVVIVIGGFFFISNSGSNNSQQNANELGNINENVRYICPDGTKVDYEYECPEPGLFEDVIFNPSNIKVFVQQGETETKILEIINNNKEQLWFTCTTDTIYKEGTFDRDVFAPSSNCHTFNEDGFYETAVKIEAGGET